MSPSEPSLRRPIPPEEGAELRPARSGTPAHGSHELSRPFSGCWPRSSFDNKLPKPPGRYDMRSKHAALFGGKKGYLYDARQVFDGVKAFVAQEKARKAGQPS